GVVSVAARAVTVRDLPPSNNPSAVYLGIHMTDVADGGVRISRVMADSPAATAGLKTDDLVVAVAGQSVQDMESLMNALQQHKAGEVIDIRVKRADQELELKAKLD